MPWKLIAYLIVLTIVVLFAGFNISNVSDISFGFHTIPKVPIFVSMFISFLLGTFLVLPFAFRKRIAKGTPQKSREVKQNEPETLVAEEAPAEPEKPVDTPKKKRGKK
jgi:uncharacterized integral membrane protein